MLGMSTRPCTILCIKLRFICFFLPARRVGRLRLLHKLAYVNSTTWNRDACTAEQLFFPKECLVIIYLC